MTTFDERESAFENKFKHDKELEFRVCNRRNKLLGLWAAQLVVGMQNADRFKYGRIDVGGNPTAFYSDGRPGYGGRFGIGYGWGDTHQGGAFASGANLGFTLSRARTAPSPHDAQQQRAVQAHGPELRA